MRHRLWRRKKWEGRKPVSLLELWGNCCNVSYNEISSSSVLVNCCPSGPWSGTCHREKGANLGVSTVNPTYIFKSLLAFNGVLNARDIKK